MVKPLNKLPILYSFRRCPYAIRARMALAHCGIEVQLREVLLAKKPDALLRISAKASVPVLVFADSAVLDESLDIMHWAINRTYPQGTDPKNWGLSAMSPAPHRLIETNDGPFKLALDGYKYNPAESNKSPQDHRADAQIFLAELDRLLCQNKFLLGDQISLVDVAIFPFIRQFAGVDQLWFDKTEYRKLQQWLAFFMHSELFTQVMVKHPVWQEKVTIS